MSSHLKREWVVIRGLGREAEHSKEFLAKLQAADPDARVCCVDLPGAGEFFKLSSPMSVESIAEFVYLQLKKKSEVEERYLIAISLGAMVVTSLLKKYPQVAQGAVLANASFANLSPFYHRLQVDGFFHIYKAATATNLLDREKAILDMVSNRADRHDFAAAWAQIAEKHPVTPLNFVKQLVAAGTYKLSEEKPQVPILVLSSAQDRMVHPSCSKKFSEFWDLPIEVHPTTGHEMWLDDGEWVIDKILTFFNKH